MSNDILATRGCGLGPGSSAATNVAIISYLGTTSNERHAEESSADFTDLAAHHRKSEAANSCQESCVPLIASSCLQTGYVPP
jgi:hypothetical protein